MGKKKLEELKRIKMVLKIKEKLASLEKQKRKH
jgi:hypothetical protein